MSGTSLDGLDLALVSFFKEKEKLSWSLEACRTVSFPSGLKSRLASPDSLNQAELEKLDLDFGLFIANEILRWKGENNLQFDLISSHGHTLFHKPEKGITLQIGNGKVIFELLNTPVVNDFRSGDVALGGQGAPLVPAGDLALFPDHSTFLNLGGIANISNFQNGKLTTAYDICPFNQVINYFSNHLDKPYDDIGGLGRSGKPIPHLIEKWNHLQFYQQTPPKSLSREWVEKNFFSEYGDEKTVDLLNSFYHHTVFQISSAIKKLVNPGKILVTGGGAKNKFAIGLLETRLESELSIPEEKLIEFKEAIIFAYLGFLRVRGETNIFAAATGASRDSVGGTLYQ